MFTDGTGSHEIQCIHIAMANLHFPLLLLYELDFGEKLAHLISILEKNMLVGTQGSYMYLRF